MNFGSHVDGIVAASAALVNAATPGQRQGRAFAPDGAGLRHGIGDALRVASPGTPDPVVARLREFVEVATSTRPLFERVEAADLAGAARVANRLLARYAPAPRLEAHDGHPPHLHYHGPRTTDPSGWGGGMAMGLATVLGSEYAHRLGVCAAPVCDRVFVDVSRNGTRRFCSMSCQNRVKAAAHRARQRE